MDEKSENNGDNMLPSRYRDVESIGAGGMGEIYRARDETLGRVVVIKVLAARYAQDEALRLRFMREALAAARVSGQRNIVTIFDVGEHGERPFIVMEYLRGGSLEAVLVHGAVPEHRALGWLEEAAAALDAAHDAGIVHRDVKPGNLLLDGHEHVYVADFGIASAAGMDSMTKPGTVLGTAGYLAPEQAKGERATAASDRYALAVVGFELLTGRRPYEAESPTAEAAAHIHAPIPSAHRTNPSLPPELDRVFDRALAKEPRARYGSAAEFVAELRHALHEAAASTHIVPPTPTRPTATRPQSGRSGWWIPALIGALVLAGIVAAVLVTRGDGQKKAAPAPKPTTVVHTVTERGTTVRQTVTAAPPPAPTTTAASTPSGSSGAALNDAGYRKMQAGDYRGARPLLEEAMQKLSGTRQLAEAYADYNLAYTRYALGDCTDVLQLLDRSAAIQGQRSEITRLRSRARQSC